MAGKDAADISRTEDVSSTVVVPSIQTSATPRPPKLWACVLASVAVNILAFLALGRFWGAVPPAPVPPAPRTFRIAILPTPPPPPKPKPRPTPPRVTPKVRPTPRRHRMRVVPRAERPRPVARATVDAPSPRPHPVQAPRPAPAGQGRQAGPAAPAPPALAPPAPAAPAAVPTLAPARVARIPLLKPTIAAPPVALTPVKIDAPPALPAPPAGGAAGQGTGKGDAVGRGSGESAGTGRGGGGGPFGIGSGGIGGGEGLRHIVYVLDISGSMTSRINKARQELKNAMAGLVPGESFDVITFSDGTHVFDTNLNPATPQMVARASYFLSTIQIGGGTNLDGALSTALAMPGVNVVVVITDGDPTLDDAYQDMVNNDQDKYFDVLTRRIRRINVNRARIYTIGLVGRDPSGRDVALQSAHLLRQLSQDSGGTSKIVPLGTADDY